MNEMWITFLEKKECQISSTVTEGKEPSCIYKNYIYREKNWECPIYGAEDHCGHYHYTLYKRIYFKNRSYKMRPSQ